MFGGFAELCRRLAGADRRQLLACAEGDSGGFLSFVPLEEECGYTWRSLLGGGWHRDPMPVPIHQPAQLVIAPTSPMLLSQIRPPQDVADVKRPPRFRLCSRKPFYALHTVLSEANSVYPTC